MGKEYFVPDEKEPHIHVHKGGATYTNTRHKHKDLIQGANVLKNNIEAVLSELEGAKDARSTAMVKWINENK